MIILAIDTTMSGCSACIYDADLGVSLAKHSLAMNRGQAEELVPLINKVLENSGISYDDLGSIAVTKGPGSFTGLRIGLATAKSLGLALDIPVYGVCTLRAVLETYLSQEKESHPYYGVLLETKRKDYYFQLFDGRTTSACSDMAALDVDDINSLIDGRGCLILGDASARFVKDSANHDLYIYHEVIMPDTLAVARLSDGNNEDCSPVYLRTPEIGTPKTQYRKIDTQ